MLAVDFAALSAVRRRPGPAGVLAGGSFAAAACLVLSLAFAAAGLSHVFFAALRFFAWGVFLHGPLLLLGGAWIHRRSRGWLFAFVGAAAAIVALAIDAFWYEPTALRVRRFQIVSSKVDRPVRIGVLADLQSEEFGDHERRAIRMLIAEEPDLILFAGDYAHVLDEAERVQEWTHINRFFHEAGLSAPLGVYAVRGDVDEHGWERAFAGLEVEIFASTRTILGEEVAVTGLSYDDGASPHIQVGGVDRLHVVLSHRPDFALGEVEADLLVAGHTHGGQVRLPCLGPVIKLSGIPRGWADGLTQLAGGRTLVVSRGVGMERGRAPRLRFLCRPEIVLIEVLPPGRN